MLAVSQAEMQAIQNEAYSAVCDKPCTIWRATTETPDGLGSKTPTYTQIAPTGNNTLNCGVNEPSGNELQNFDAMIGDKIAWKVHLPVSLLATIPGGSLLPQDQVRMESQVLEVHVQLTPRSYPALLSAICAEIK